MSVKVKDKKKTFLFVVLGTILAPIVLIFAYQAVKYAIAQSSVTNARKQAEAVADIDIAGKVDFLKSSGVVSDQIAHSKYDICYVNHADQGWFVASWYQDCYLRYVYGYTTSLSKQEVGIRLKKSSPIFDGAVNTSANGCELLRDSDYKEVIRFRPAGSPVDESGQCDIPDQLQGTTSVVGPVIFDSGLSSHEFSGFDANAIGSDKDQIWLMLDSHYYHESLGCGVGLFCANPRPSPARAQ